MADCVLCGRSFDSDIYCEDTCFDLKEAVKLGGPICCPDCIIEAEPMYPDGSTWGICASCMDRWREFHDAMFGMSHEECIEHFYSHLPKYRKYRKYRKHR